MHAHTHTRTHTHKHYTHARTHAFAHSPSLPPVLYILLLRDAARQAMLDGQQAISTNLEQLAKHDGSAGAADRDAMQLDEARHADDGAEEAEAAAAAAREAPQTAAEAEAALKLWGLMEQRTSAQVNFAAVVGGAGIDGRSDIVV